jgi:pimeloyl-ACP methyl ester carboxylesterase
MNVKYHTTDVNGIKIFYREAGRPGAPTLLLLHGFPSSSHMFRDLIPLLAEKYHLVAPDFPGFGRSDMPDRGKYQYTFANIADTITGFTGALGLKKFAIYIFDYGSPVGLRMAL